MAAKKIWNDQATENVIGNLLRAGVVLAAAIVGCGAVLFLHKYGRLHTDYRSFRGEPGQLSTLTGIFHEAFSFHGRGIIQLGLLLLIATPVARVAFSIWAFEQEKDRMYTGFTVIVLAVLLYSLFGPGV
jgi:uncharacterized membrane protein